MNLIRRAWRWLTTPRKDTVPDQIKRLNEKVDDQGHELRSTAAELERQAHERALVNKPDLTDDPGTDVPAPHLGQVSHVDLTRPVAPGERAPAHLQDLTPSDWDLLSPEEKALFEQITPRDVSKVVRYPAPVEQSTADWVSEQLAKAGYSESYHQRFMGFRRVAVGMSMRHLNALKRRADERDSSLSTHDLIALRSRGIA